MGVDLSDAMLRRGARRRVRRTGLRNVELVEADVREYALPGETSAVIATFGLEMVPEHETVVRRVAEVLQEGGRLVLLGLNPPDRWPDWLVELGMYLNRPFGVSRDYASIRPWLSLRAYLEEIHYHEMLGGAAYMSVGEAKPVNSE